MHLLLIILKYFGFALATASSIWGTTHELSVKSENNRKTLTKAGYISIGLVIAGLILSIVSEDISRRITTKERDEKTAAEARRTNEITIASQPLTSLDFVIEFESTDTSFRRKMMDAEAEIDSNALTSQGGVPLVPFSVQEYQSSLIPMLQYLAGLGHIKNKKPKILDDYDEYTDGIVALLPLDRSPNAVLSFGEVLGDAEWWDEKDSANQTPPGILIGRTLGDRSVYTTRKISFAGPSTYTIGWGLDPLALESAINRANTNIRSVAKLPPVLNVMIMRIGKTLPFSINNFAATNTNLWYKDTLAMKNVVQKIPNASLSLVVNGFSELEFRYKLTRIYEKSLFDNRSGDPVEIGCTVLEFTLNQ